MPTAIKSKSKTDKIVEYYADGRRETIGYRVEEWEERSERTGPRASIPDDPARPPFTKPSVSSRSSHTGSHGTSASTAVTGRALLPTRSVRPAGSQSQSKKLPPIVHTETSSSKESRNLVSRAKHLPAGWIHKEKHERYDYHKGVMKPSYAVNSVTHKVGYYPATPVRPLFSLRLPSAS